MKRVILVLLIICSVMFCSACGNKDTSSCKNGIEVLGDGDYYWHMSDSYGCVLFIESDGLTITGEAETKMFIDVAEDVSSLNVTDLNQGRTTIDVMFSNREDNYNTNILNFDGVNNISSIEGGQTLEIKSNIDSDVLNVTEYISVVGNLRFMNGIITAPFIESYENITIEDTSCIVLEQTSSENSEEFGERLSASKKIIINITDGGYIEIVGNDEIDPIVGWEGIEMGNEIIVKSPVNGYIAPYNTNYDDQFVIFNENGEIDKHIIIEYK